jgi:two-component system chemotaxis sensor kinase CheA
MRKKSKIGKNKSLNKVILLIIVVTLIFVVLAVLITGQYNDRREVYQKNAIQKYDEQYQTIVYCYRLLAESYYDKIISNERILEIMWQANYANKETSGLLRNELYELSLYDYERAINDNFRQYHFVLHDNTSFLRMHEPIKYGDDLSDVRESVRIANEECIYVEGFEEGKDFNGYRFEYPLFYKDENIGCVEVSLTYTAIVNLMKELFNTKVKLLVKKKIVDENVWTDLIDTRYDTVSFSENYYIDIETKNHQDRETAGPGILELIDDNIELNGDALYLNVTKEDIDYSIVFLNISNIKGEHAGYLLFTNESYYYNGFDDRFSFLAYGIAIVWVLVIIMIMFVVYNKIKADRDKIEKWNQELVKRVQEKTESIKNILDNAGQGFLIFDKDLVVSKEYSKECITIFEKDIDNLKIDNLLFEDDIIEKQTFVKGVEMIQVISDEFQKNMVISLLPQDFQYHNKLLDFEYKLLPSNDMMMIISDITQKKMLEKQVLVEQNKNRMIVACVKNKKDLVEILDAFNKFIGELKRQCSIKDSCKYVEIQELYRNFHTYKGLFLLLHFMELPDYIHEIENSLSGFTPLDSIEKDILKGIIDIKKIERLLATEMEAIADVFDKVAQSKKIYTMDNTQLCKLEKMVSLLEKDTPLEKSIAYMDSINVIKSLRNVNLKELLESYPRYVAKLSARYDKLILPFEIEGDEVFVIGEKVDPFIRTLVHVFRNAISHGLESPDERLAKGKSEYGSIRCIISKKDNIVIKIEDDGRGIDLDRIKKLAVSKKLISKEKISTLTKEKTLELLFIEGFSTNDEADLISGRGMGLSAVRSELEKLGGSMEIHSTKEKGTSFIFRLQGEGYENQ